MRLSPVSPAARVSCSDPMEAVGVLVGVTCFVCVSPRLASLPGLREGTDYVLKSR